jgi:hypothetical protein
VGFAQLRQKISKTHLRQNFSLISDSQKSNRLLRSLKQHKRLPPLASRFTPTFLPWTLLHSPKSKPFRAMTIVWSAVLCAHLNGQAFPLALSSVYIVQDGIGHSGLELHLCGR